MSSGLKKAIITCAQCQHEYYSGFLVDAKGAINLDEDTKNPGVCPSCETPATGDTGDSAQA